MVTKYDLFELIYRNKSPMKPIEVVKEFDKSEREYPAIHKQLRELVIMKLIKKTKYGFEINITKKVGILYGIIQYCLKNNVNYNKLLDKNLVAFVSMALQKQEITSKNININQKTFKKYIEILNKFGLVLIVSRKPLRVRIFYNILLNNLLVYFDYKHEIIAESFQSYNVEIEKELRIFKRLQRKNETLYKKIVREFEISFVYHSLSLEGNPITLSDTFRILQNKIIPSDLKSIDVDEVKNYQEAILQMIKDSTQKKVLNLAMVLNYHLLAMRHVPSLAGKIRAGEVYIKGNPHFSIVKARDIRKELNLLFEKYNVFIKRKRLSLEELLNFAVYFHNEFQHIHPFVDGNSRTTRLITFHLLQSQNIPIFDLPFGLLDEYLGYTKGLKKRDDKKLFQTLQKVVLWNLKKINERLG